MACVCVLNSGHVVGASVGMGRQGGDGGWVWGGQPGIVRQVIAFFFVIETQGVSELMDGEGFDAGLAIVTQVQAMPTPDCL